MNHPAHRILLQPEQTKTGAERLENLLYHTLLLLQLFFFPLPTILKDHGDAC